MRFRRIASISLRVLAVYLFIRGIETLLGVIANDVSSGSWDRWLYLAAGAVPIAGAIVLWANADRLAVRLGKSVPISPEEIDRVLASEEQEVEDAVLGDEHEAGSPPADPAEWLVPGLTLLGAYFLVRAVEFALYNLASLALFRQTCLARRFGEGNCSFWEPDTWRVLISLGTQVVLLILGAWLILNPAGFLDAVRRVAQRLRGSREERLVEVDD